MFETAVVRARRRRYPLLSFSLAIHIAVIAAVIAATLASTRLPEQAPRQMVPVYLAPLITLPPALGVPHPAAASKAPAGPRTPTAPAVIPSTIAAPSPEIAQSGPGDIASTPGLPSGTPGGIGTTDAPSSAAPDATGPLTIGDGVKSPIVIQRVDPLYPPIALRARMTGSVVLQCIIDKTGHIRDVRVMRSTFSAFEQPAIDAVKQWLFAPGTLNGLPVDTIFELTVRFQVR